MLFQNDAARLADKAPEKQPRLLLPLGFIFSSKLPNKSFYRRNFLANSKLQVKKLL